MTNKTSRLRWSNVVKIVLIITLLLSTLPPASVLANPEGTDPSGGGGGGGDTNAANEMSRSMINFFREERTNLQVERVARDELIVYGVFMSNFFVPWQTRLKDFADDSSDNSIPKKVSEKFFGSKEKSSQVAEINKKLHEAISTTMGHNKETFTMYAKRGNTSGQGMTGKDFYNKIAGKDSDPIVYGSNGQVLMNLKDPATQASLQVLFGFSPIMMLSEDSGLRALTGMYMDGLGNIWGSHASSSVEDYVLVLPSALNPAVFPKNGSEFKFPAVNVFSMGGTLKATENFLSDKHYMTPYYNINRHIPNSTYNANNAVTIFGIQSPSTYVGKTNDIIKNGVSNNPWSNVQEMVNADASSRMHSSRASIAVSVDPTKIGSADGLIKNDKNLNDTQKRRVIDYLFKTSTFTLDQVADQMYYFDVPMAQSQNASGGEGSFANVEDLVRSQKLFAKETDRANEFEFYRNSFMASPFLRFLKGYQEASNKDTYLRNNIKASVNTSSAEYRALKSFLEKGEWGTTNVETVRKAMGLLKESDNLVYGLVYPSSELNRVVQSETLWGVAGRTSEPVTFGLSNEDRNTTLMSAASRNSSFWGRMSSSYDVTTRHPFGVNKSGGTISTDGNSALSSRQVNSLSTYFHTFNSYYIFSMNSTFTGSLTGTAAGKGKYSTPWGSITNRTAVMDGVNNYPGIYWGYMVELLNIRPNSDGTGFLDPTPYENEHLPYMEISTLGGGLDLNEVLGLAGVVASEDRTLEEMQRDIVKKVYGLLSEEPNEYRDKLIKSTTDSWVIATHRAITGSWVGDAVSVSAGGNNTYGSVVGYINTPSLADLPLTDWILNDYMYIYLMLMLFTLIVLVLMVLINARTIRAGALLFIIMAFFFILPQFLVGNVINLSNKMGDQIYSERFNYWAITQHQQSFDRVNGARLSGDEMDYIVARSMESARNVYSNDVGVRIKWMSPKKDDMFERIFNSNTAGQGLMENLTIFRWLFSSYLNQEEYVHDDPLATYVYRPYNAISKEADDGYNAMRDRPITRAEAVNKTLNSRSRVLNLPDYRFSLYENPKGTIDYAQDQLKLIEDAKGYATNSDTDLMENYRYWALNSQEVTDAIFRSTFSDNAGFTGNIEDPYYQSFSLMSESPFYYFYNALRLRYADGDAEFKSALLDDEMFRVRSPDASINNSLRDFLDMEGLFTYVIPYMHQGNQYVYGWTNIYGKDIDGYDFSTGVAPAQDENPFLYEQFMSEEAKKRNLKQVWRLYTPWVDQMYSIGVYDQRIYAGGKRETVSDTMNPGAYEEAGRQMIFSEADMHAKSYKYSDLSDIERRIQATLDATYTDLLYLTNYYDFKDEVLITAAAMSATFNFNREFSEYRLIGESNILYPQTFELKNFNYDAFLRLTLLNATGEPLMADKDLYVRILEKTSVFTGILLLVNDILGVIVIPTFKIVVLLLLFFLSILLCITCIVSPPEKIFKTVAQSLLLPSFLFLVYSVVFAFVISLFMGEGLTGYVGGRTPDINVTDPTIMLGLMAFVNCVYVFLLWKLVRLLLSSFKSHGIKGFFGSYAVVAGAMTAAGLAVKNRIQNKTMMRRMRNSGFGGHGSYGGGYMGDGSPMNSQDGKGTNGQGTNGSQQAGGSTPSGIGVAGGNPAGLGGGAGSGSDPTSKFKPDNLANSSRDIDSRPNENKGVEDKELHSMLNNLSAPKSSDKSAPSSNNISSRTVGNKLVDFKYSMKGTSRNVADKANYMFSKDGAYSDMKKKTNSAYVNSQLNINNYSSDVLKYEATKLQDSINQQSSVSSPASQSRVNADQQKLAEIERKIANSEKRSALLRNKLKQA